MKKNILYIIFCVLSVCTTACMDDKTNLEYKDIILPDSVMITDLRTGNEYYLSSTYNPIFTVTLGSELQLDANVKYKGDDELSYEWRIDFETVSSEKNLRYLVTEKHDYAYLVIHRKNAQNATLYSFSIKVHNRWTSGIAILGTQNGKTQFDFVERYWHEENVEWGSTVVPNFTLIEYIGYENIYPTFNNGEELPGNHPVKIDRVVGATSSISSFQILDKEWSNSIAIDKETMKKTVQMKDEFIASPPNFEPVNFVSVGKTSVIQDKSGKLYTRVNYDRGNPNTGRFTDQPIMYTNPDNNQLVEVIEATDIISKGYLALIYEKSKKRILAWATGPNNIEYSQFFNLERPTNAGNLPANYANLNNFDKELIALLAPASPIYENYFIIYKDNDKYYLQSFTFKLRYYTEPFTLTYTAVNNIELSSDICKLLDKGNNQFYVNYSSKTYQDDIFFSAGNEIYQMSTDGKTVKRVCRFNDKNKITQLIITSTWYDETWNGWQRYFNGRVLAAAFDDGDMYVIRLYDDPSAIITNQIETWCYKHYDGGVQSMIFF